MNTFNTKISQEVLVFNYKGYDCHIVLFWHKDEPRFNGYVSVGFDGNVYDTDKYDFPNEITFWEEGFIGFDHFHLHDKNNRNGLSIEFLTKELKDTVDILIESGFMGELQ